MAKETKELVISGKDKLEKLSELLIKNIQLYESDREIAIEHYNLLKSRMEEMYEGEDGNGALMSEDAALEKASNEALKIIIRSSDKLDRIINAVTQVIMAQLNNESREIIADKLRQGGSMIPNRPVSFDQLKNRKTHEIDYEEEED